MVSLKEQIAVMQAFADGKQVEVRNRASESWIGVDGPTWDWFSQEYRVTAPKPDEIDWSAIREEYRWIARHENGEAVAYYSKPVMTDSGWCSYYEHGQPLALPVSGFLSSYRNNGMPWKESLIERP